MDVNTIGSITPDSHLTSHECGALLQVNPSSINKWAKEKRIECFRTPGGHRRFKAKDLVAFLKAQGMPVHPKLEACTMQPEPEAPKPKRATKKHTAKKR